MDDAAAVRRREPAGDLHRVVERGPQRQRRRADARAERVPLEQFDGGVRRAVVRADVVDRDDVGMRECGNGPGLTVEPLAELRIHPAARRQDLDRDLPVQARVARTVHLAHSAGADGRQNLVRAEACSGVERQARPDEVYVPWPVSGL